MWFWWTNTLTRSLSLSSFFFSFTASFCSLFLNPFLPLQTEMLRTAEHMRTLAQLQPKCCVVLLISCRLQGIVSVSQIVVCRFQTLFSSHFSFTSKVFVPAVKIMFTNCFILWTLHCVVLCSQRDRWAPSLWLFRAPKSDTSGNAADPVLFLWGCVVILTDTNQNLRTRWHPSFLSRLGLSEFIHV